MRMGSRCFWCRLGRTNFFSGENCLLLAIDTRGGVGSCVSWMLVEVYMFAMYTNQSTCSFFSSIHRNGMGVFISLLALRLQIASPYIISGFPLEVVIGVRQLILGNNLDSGVAELKKNKKDFKWGDMLSQNKIPTPPRITCPRCVPSASGSHGPLPRSWWPLVFVCDQHGLRGDTRQEGVTFTLGLSPMCWDPNIPQRFVLAAGGFRGGVRVMSQRCCVIRVLCSKEFSWLKCFNTLQWTWKILIDP